MTPQPLSPRLAERLPNLDALRFVAFSAVLLAHAYNVSMDYTSDDRLYRFYMFMKYGVWGVNFFFVLSGFLITHLLLQDVETHGKPRLKRFYVRRILRIWPLYIVVLIGAAVHYALASLGDTNTRWIYFLLFAGNFHILHEGYPLSQSLSSLWTIGVEEQFYLVAPLLVLWFRNRLALVTLSLIVASAAFRFSVSGNDKQVYFNTLSVMNDLTVGMLLAVATQKLKANSIRVHWAKQLVIAGALVTCIWLLETVQIKAVTAVFTRLAVSVFFAYVVFQQVFVSNRGFNVQQLPGFDYLGNISYGLYMYHMFALLIVVNAFEQFDVTLSGIHGLVTFPFCVFVFSTVVAAMSYAFVEKNILRLKSVWAR